MERDVKLSDSGALQFFLYGIVGLTPAALSSWLAHKYGDEPQRALPSSEPLGE